MEWLHLCALCVQGDRAAPEEGGGRERGDASDHGGSARPKRSSGSMRARAGRPHAGPISRGGCSSPRARQPMQRVRIVSFSPRRTRPSAGVSPDAERVRRERRLRALSNDFDPPPHSHECSCVWHIVRSMLRMRTHFFALHHSVRPDPCRFRSGKRYETQTFDPTLDSMIGVESRVNRAMSTIANALPRALASEQDDRCCKAKAMRDKRAARRS